MIRLLRERLYRRKGRAEERSHCFWIGTCPTLRSPWRRRGLRCSTQTLESLTRTLLPEDLPGRIFVTNNPPSFHYSASLLDFSTTETADVTKDPQSMAEIIARAWVDYSLKAEHPAFLLVLRQNGRHDLKTDL
jgi:hypothetical protein